MLFPSVVLKAADDEWKPASLVVYTTDNQRATYVLTDSPHVTFNGNTVKLSTQSVSISYDFDKLSKFEIEHETGRPDGILETKKDGARFHVTDEGLTSEGLTPGTLVQAFTLDGICVGQSRVNEQGSCKLPLNYKSNTVLVIKAGTFTYKIHKK